MRLSLEGGALDGRRTHADVGGLFSLLEKEARTIVRKVTLASSKLAVQGVVLGAAFSGVGQTFGG